MFKFFTLRAFRIHAAAPRFRFTKIQILIFLDAIDPTMTVMTSVNSCGPSALIIGAGATGMGAALTLREAGWAVTVVTEDPAPGGSARTFREEGFLCEAGPNTALLSKPEVVAFLEKHRALATALDAAPNAKRRFLLRDDRLLAIPTAPPALLGTPLLSPLGKLRVLGDLFAPRGTDDDESVLTFFARRIGREAAREFLDPFVSGIYAGDPSRLVMRHAMPAIFQMEREHGGIVRGFIAKAKARRREGGPPRTKSRLVSWPLGIGQLFSILSEPLGPSLMTSTRIEEITRQAGKFVARSERGTFEANHLILATPAREAARLAGPLSEPARKLLDIPQAPMCVVHLGYRREKIGHPLDGFGALISRARGVRTLGVLFSSTLFPGRAPENHVLLTAFIGGRKDPEALHLNDRDLTAAVLFDIAPLLGIQGNPAFHRVTRWPEAIPQYEAGHDRFIAACEAAESQCPGLHLAGNYRGGISMPDCLVQGTQLASRIIASQG